MEPNRLRSHLTGSVPISIAIHVVLVMMLVAIPLIANVVIPTISVTLPEYVRLAPMPPPPVVAVRPPAGAPVVSRPEPSPVPTKAPDTLEPEREPPPPAPGPLVPPTPGATGGRDGVAIGNTLTTPMPPPPPDLPKQVRVADLPVAPRKTVDARPVYPDVARMARVDGTVVMEAVLDPTGRVTQIRVIRSIPLLDQAAMDAVRQWRYTPSTYYGRPVSVLMTITIHFTLQ